ncbi:MAG: hypothetical protein AMXMBFR36_17710 [Acidobacteriota bacterium]
MRRGVTATVVAALLALPAFGAERDRRPAPEPEPFYLDLERSAEVALTRGEAAVAARKLRLACFGMLDLPERLGACLVKLGVAQGDAGDRAGFEETFERLDALEGRFPVYSSLRLEPELRARFEERLKAWISVETLASRPAFRPLAWVPAPREEKKPKRERRP